MNPLITGLGIGLALFGLFKEDRNNEISDNGTSGDTGSVDGKPGSGDTVNHRRERRVTGGKDNGRNSPINARTAGVRRDQSCNNRDSEPHPGAGDHQTESVNNTETVTEEENSNATNQDSVAGSSGNDSRSVSTE